MPRRSVFSSPSRRERAHVDLRREHERDAAHRLRQLRLAERPGEVGVLGAQRVDVGEHGLALGHGPRVGGERAQHVRQVVGLGDAGGDVVAHAVVHVLRQHERDALDQPLLDRLELADPVVAPRHRLDQRAGVAGQPAQQRGQRERALDQRAHVPVAVAPALGQRGQVVGHLGRRSPRGPRRARARRSSASAPRGRARPARARAGRARTRGGRARRGRRRPPRPRACRRARGGGRARRAAPRGRSARAAGRGTGGRRRPRARRCGRAPRRRSARARASGAPRSGRAAPRPRRRASAGTRAGAPAGCRARPRRRARRRAGG